MALRLRFACCAAAATALAVPGAADAAKRTVYMGIPPASQKLFEKTGSDVNAFFPSSIRIRSGDSVAFTPVGFHNVDMPAAGQKPLDFVAPTGKAVSGENDETGAPFWFNSLPEFSLNPELVRPSFGKTVVKGAKRVSSGLPLSDKPKPFNVRFPKAGTFTYYCTLHAGMKGTVRVVGKRSPVPSAKLNALRVKQQVAAALGVAKKLPAATKPAANTVHLGADGKGGVHYFGFLPEKLTVASGTTVTFGMPTRSTEVHTASFGPTGKDEKSFPASYIGKLTASLESPAIAGAALYPSEAPGAPASYTSTLHGNGFWNTGFLDGIAASPLPQTSSVTFATPGTYSYVCIVHPFMRGSVTVQ